MRALSIVRRILNLPTIWTRTISFTYQTLSPGKQLLLAPARRFGGPHSQSGRCGRDNSLPLVRINPDSSKFQAPAYSLHRPSYTAPYIS